MKGYYDAKLAEALSLASGDSYSIAYEYDLQGRIVKETVTGDIARTVAYTYDENDNIITEIINVNGKTITKTYSYDTYNNITNVATVVS